MPPPFRLRQHDFKHIDAFLTDIFVALMKTAERIVVTLNGRAYTVGRGASRCGRRREMRE